MRWLIQIYKCIYPIYTTVQKFTVGTILCNIYIYIFIVVTFDRFNLSLQNKCIINVLISLRMGNVCVIGTGHYSLFIILVGYKSTKHF